MADAAYTLCKNERLCGKQAISDLFGSGSTFFVVPYKVFWLKVSSDDGNPSQFAVSIPKRRFKRAVKRNLMKRRTREMFRLNKRILNDAVENGQQIRLMVVYASDYLLPTPDLEPAMKKILQRIVRDYGKSI